MYPSCLDENVVRALLLEGLVLLQVSVGTILQVVVRRRILEVERVLLAGEREQPEKNAPTKEPCTTASRTREGPVAHCRHDNKLAPF